MPYVGHRGLSGGQVLSTFQWTLVLFFLVAAGLAMFAAFVYAMCTRSEVGKKYRSSSVINALITGVAGIAYVILVGFWIAGYRLQGEVFVPSSTHFFATSLRYVDWVVTVPLLMAEFVAVAGIDRSAAAKLRGPMMASAGLMIVTGFIGQALNEGYHPNQAAFAIWGAISTVFFLALYPMFAGALKTSATSMGAESAKNLRGAVGLLLVTWLVYPAVYVVFGFTRTSVVAAVAVQIAFSVTDVVAKVGYGMWIHKVAKLRTAEDALAGEPFASEDYAQEVYLAQELVSLPAGITTDTVDVTTAGARGHRARA
jgi:bacteriorhodopsin